MAAQRGDAGGGLTRKGAATRERILSVAAELMYHQGAERTSLGDVIDASSTGKSQMYHYFADKQALVDGVVQVQIDAVLAAQACLLDEVDTVRGLQRWRDAVVAMNRGRHSADGCPMGSLAGELADHSESARRLLADGFADWEALVGRALTRLRDGGHLAATASPEHLARGLLAALQGGLLLAQTTRDAGYLETALDMALDHVRSLAPGYTS